MTSFLSCHFFFSSNWNSSNVYYLTTTDDCLFVDSAIFEHYLLFDLWLRLTLSIDLLHCLWGWMMTAQITERVLVSRVYATTCARVNCRGSSAPNSSAAPPSVKPGVIPASNAQPNSTATKDSCAISTAASASVNVHLSNVVHHFNWFHSFLIFSCKDIDECEAIPALCEGGQCVNTVGSFRCECPPGQERDEDTNECREADECQQEGICQNGQCVNTDAGYYCICNKGFISSQDRKSCIGNLFKLRLN